MEQTKNSPLIDIDFKVNKPFILFGKRYDEVDVNFYNFDLRDDFKQYHFFGQPKYEILPEIKNADTILQFTLPFEKEFKKYTYLLLNIWDDETLWRIHATQMIYYHNKLALQFDCKRDFFNEYFSLNKNEFKLQNVYLLRSNIMKPSLENLRICSNACLNDISPSQENLDSYNRGKKLITSQEFDGEKFWEISTTNSNLFISIMNEILPSFGNLFFEKVEKKIGTLSLIKDILNPSHLTIDNNTFSFNVRYVSRPWPKVDYFNYTFSFQGDTIPFSQLSSSGNTWEIPVSYVWNRINKNPLTNLIGRDNNAYGFLISNEKYLFFDTIKKIENKSFYQSGGQWWADPCSNGTCDTSNVNQLLYCDSSIDGKFYYAWYERYARSFCGKNFLKVNGSINFKFLNNNNRDNYIKFAKQDYGGDGGFRYPNDISSATYFNNQEPKSIYLKLTKNYNVINQIVKCFNLDKSSITSLYDQTIEDFFTLMRNRIGVQIRQVSLDNAGVDYFKSVGFADFRIYDAKGNSVGYGDNFFTFQIAKRVKTRQFKVYDAKTLTSHYEATHIKDYIIGNSIGVFNVDRTKDYEVVNRDSGEQIVFPTELSEILETGNITIEKSTLEQIGQGQLELEKVRALLELRDKQGELLTKTKIDRVNRDADYQKGFMKKSTEIDTTNKIWNLVGTIGGGVAGGMAGGFSGASRGAYLGNRLMSNLTSIIGGERHTNLNIEKLEFKTKNEVADIWDDNEMSKKFKNEQFDLENYFNMKVSGHLVNTNTIKFPWIDSRRALYLLRLNFGSKEKIEYEREVFGDFINQYVDIDKSKLLGRSFILIDTNKSDVLDFPGLNAIGQEIIKRLLNKGIFIFNPNKQSTGITRVW